MKKINVSGSWIIVLVLVLWCIAAVSRHSSAAPLKSARVSQVIQDVRLLKPSAPPRPAVVNDQVAQGMAVHTGADSRTELTFSDLTITRLGQNTIFTLSEEAREVRLDAGSILLQVPPNAPEARIKTAAVTAAITGGTALFAVGPPTKFMLLEGFGIFYPTGHPELAVHLKGGEMVMMTAGGHITPVTTFSVPLVLSTAHLIIDFPALANLPLILNIVNQQQAELFLVTQGPPPGRDIIDVVDQNATANPIVLAVRTETPTPTPTATPTSTPTATPTKFGTPPVISSPLPYVITSGTVITTDPSITTNGVTDYGKIYRGPTDDGPFSLWAFGSTSAFDNELHLDTTEFFADPANLPIAVFKFQSLSLNGNPTIDTTNGVTRLGLIGVDGITSGPPGGTLTFTGLDGLYLGTVNGSINLTSDISFANLGVLAIYARGSGSNLTINSPITNIGRLALAAEGSLQLTNPGTMTIGRLGVTAGNLSFEIGGSLLLDGKVRFDAVVLPGDTTPNGANVTVSIDGDYMNSSTTDSSEFRVWNQSGHIGTGGNVSVTTGGNFNTSGDAEFIVQNTTGTINNGGNLTLDIGGNLTSHAFSLLLENWDFSSDPAGHIVNGGNISFTTGGNFTADSSSIAINNRGGGMIDSAASIIVNIGGTLTTLENGSDFLGNPTSFEIDLATRFDDQGGNIQPSAVGGNATVSVTADSASIGGVFDATLSNRGGSIGGSALISFNIAHNFNVTGVDTTLLSAATFQLLNDSGPPVSGADTPLGGTIHGDATLQVNTANLTVPAGSLVLFLNNQNRALTGGTIDGNATVNLTASAISVGSNFDAEILNERGADATGLTGGSIGTDATLNIAASSLSVGGELDAIISNNNNGSPSEGSRGGSIGGDANVGLAITGNLMSTGPAFFGIFNESNVGIAPGGTTAGDARLEVMAGTFSIGDRLTSRVNTNGGGQIMGDAVNSIIAGATLMAQAGFDIEIDDTIFGGNTGGHIGGDATVTLGALNITTPSTNSGIPGADPMAIEGSIYSNAAGFVGGDATVTVTAGQGISAPGSVLFWVANGNYQDLGGGMIGGNATVNITAANLSSGDLFTQILNYGGASIGSDAAILLGLSNLSSNNLDALIDNRSGQIGMNATIDYSLLGLLDSQGNMMFRILNGILSPRTGQVPGGTINGNAEITVAAANLHASTLLAQIDNTAGQITSDATIQFNVSGTAMVDNDATVAIDGSSGAANAAVNFNGGNYNVSGTFRSTISDDGLMTFNNATMQADVFKAGVFGPNGTLNVGGGMLSGDTELKLYAPGSNGQINFTSDVTLGGNGTKILAANAVTIFDDVVVTIGGKSPADVYVNFSGEIPNANYTGFGGNGSTTGTFAGAGANNPQPLSQAPPFDPTQEAPRSGVAPRGGNGYRPGTSYTRSVRGRATADTININNTSQLLSLLDDATPAPGGRISIAAANRAGGSRKSNRIDRGNRLKANRASPDARRMRDRPATRTVALQ